MSNLKRIRTEKNITREKLGELSGVSYRMIEKYEQGIRDINKAQAETLYKIAQALKCTIEELLENIPNTPGEWEEVGDWLLACSNCDNVIKDPNKLDTPKYCPNCSKPMKPYIRK